MIVLGFMAENEGECLECIKYELSFTEYHLEFTSILPKNYSVYYHFIFTMIVTRVS